MRVLWAIARFVQRHAVRHRRRHLDDFYDRIVGE